MRSRKTTRQEAVKEWNINCSFVDVKIYACSALYYSKALSAGVFEFNKFFFHYVTAVALLHIMTALRFEKPVKEAKVN